MSKALPLEEAHAGLLASVEPLGSEIVGASAAADRWLTEDLVARRTSPEADLSAMDGFATAGSGPWRIVGESAAGRSFAGTLGPNQATGISTGAHVPTGAEAILLREDSRVADGLLQAISDKPSPMHIRRAGFDFLRDEVVMDAGTSLGPAQIALALAAGWGSLPVGRQPSVAILDTGDELVADPAAAVGGRIPATNGPMIAAMTARLARQVQYIGPVGDERTAIREAMVGASWADVIVTSGGASVGDHDLVRPVLEDWGASIDFWRVAIRPGKPFLMARKGRQVFLALPGNPASAYVTTVLFVLPLLRRLAGASPDGAMPRRINAILAEPAPEGGGRREFLRARWANGRVAPLPERDSSALRTLALAQALIDRPAGCAPAACGEEVSVILA